MIPWTLVDTATIPGGGEMRLMRRGLEFSIKLGGNELMNSRLSGSEQALATFACDLIATRNRARLLIGGLGMGFTLRAALNKLPQDAHIDVAELVPAVIAWARGPMAEIFAHSLSDRRVHLRQTDVATMIAADAATYDAILLDVDNGPEGLSRPGNDSLYDLPGLSAAHTALRAGGVLSVWSSAPDPNFTHRLRQAGFSVEEKRVRANAARGGARHVIWLATRA